MRLVYFYYFFDDEEDTLKAEYPHIEINGERLSVTGDDITDLKNNAEIAIIEHCQELWDVVATNERELSEEEEAIASDVLQGAFKIIVKRKGHIYE